MSWPWVFILFLLASTSRVEDSAPSSRYQELLCRMFGTAGKPPPAECSKWKDEGCGDLWRESPLLPTLGGNGVKVGWAETRDETTSITFSFEKEWLGAPPRLYEWYGPAGTDCKRIFQVLDNSQKIDFLKKFRDFNPHRLSAWEKHPAVLQVQPHNLLPLERSDEAERWGMSQFIEYDSGPWEIKADTFYYSVEEMEEAVTNMLPYVDVPGDFPAERRIQIHVVAPISPDILQNREMQKSFRLIQLYFSDYMFLRLIFPNGPNGERCKAKRRTPIGRKSGAEDFGGEAFKCDVFTDQSNDVIDKASAQYLYDLDDKQKIVGIRNSFTYEEASRGDGLERVGFEIRKSESLADGVFTARAVANAIARMGDDGTTGVGIHTEPRDIRSVETFALGSRMNLPGDGKCFCDRPQDWGTTLKKLAQVVVGEAYSRSSGYYDQKLKEFLTLLLCSNWAELLGADDAGERRGLLANFKSLSPRSSDDAMKSFRTRASQYAYALSQRF